MKDSKAAQAKVLKLIETYETENEVITKLITKKKSAMDLWNQKNLNEAAIAGLYRQLKRLKEADNHDHAVDALDYLVTAMGDFVSNKEKGMAIIGSVGTWSGTHKKSKINEEFKVGDYVLPKSSYVDREGSVFTFKSGAYEIEKITGTHIYLKNVDYPYFEKDDLTLVCRFVKGEPIYADDYDKDCNNEHQYIFDSYRPDLEEHFIVLARNGRGLQSFKYAKAIDGIKYKPYSEPKLEWIKEKKQVKTKNLGWVGTISDIGRNKQGDWILQVDGLCTATLEELFNDCVWLDGSVFGDEA